jgi:hypothetical protein
VSNPPLCRRDDTNVAVGAEPSLAKIVVVYLLMAVSHAIDRSQPVSYANDIAR